MKLYRALTSLGAAAMAAVTFSQYASTEVMLVSDLGNGTAAHPAQIERYDPYTGAYLGAFGAGYFQGTNYSVNVIGQNAYVTDEVLSSGQFYSRIDVFNFSTGAYQGDIFNVGPFQLTSTSTYGGNLICSDYGSNGSVGYIWTLSPTGTLISTTTLPSGDLSRAATVVGSQLYVATQTLNTGAQGMLVYNLNSNGTTNGAPTTLISGTAFESVVATTVNGVQYEFGGGYSGSNGLIQKWNAAGGAVAQYSIAGDASGAISLAAGHNGILYALDQAHNTAVRYDGGNSFFLGPMGSFSLSQTQVSFSISVYSAPEPFSALGLGLGIAAVAIRRRRKTSSR